MIKEKIKKSPIMTFIILIFSTILISGFLHFINIQSEYTTVNPVTSDLVNNVIEVKNLFSLRGIKHIVTTAVSGFVNFEPLPMLIIVLIGIGMLEKSGFLKTFFTLITRNTKKYTVTFILILISLLFSVMGNIGYVVMLPIGALLFKYGKRNPLGGIIATFASLSFGYGINVFLSNNDSTLLSLTLNAARTIDPKYNINVFYALFFMIVAVIILAILFTNITEKKVMTKLSRYDYDEDEYNVTNKDLRGLVISVGVGILYLLIIGYMIIPGLPLSGTLLDHSGTRYIDMLFGSNSLFSQGFIFIVTLWFVIIGLVYGYVTKKFKNNNDVAIGLGHSLDDIGGILVLIFFASLFINVYEESNIGIVITAFLTKLISALSFNGIMLIVISFILIGIANIFCPNSITKWSIISATLVPLFINSSISPEYANIIYNLGDSVTNGLTPLLTYFVIYVAFMEKYNKSEKTITLFGSQKFMLNYACVSFIVMFMLIVCWYLIGIPTGIGANPGIVYGA